MLGKTLAQYCKSDSAVTKEQKRIEGELIAFEKNIWGDQQLKDSLDSIAKAQQTVKGKAEAHRQQGCRCAVSATKKHIYKGTSEEPSG